MSSFWTTLACSVIFIVNFEHISLFFNLLIEHEIAGWASDVGFDLI